MLFNLDFADSAFVLSCFFFLFLTIDLIVPAVNAHIFYTILELEIPIRIPAKETEAKIEIHLIILEDKIRKSSI